MMEHNFPVSPEACNLQELYDSLRNRDCGTDCSGQCRGTCVSLGRKFEDLPGAGAKGLSVVRQDNLMCEDTDPYQ